MGGAPPLEATRLKKRWRRYLGRYELVGELARGGMGTVYLARQGGEAGFQRLFAIKVMHPHLAAETDFVDMLRDEARIAARIHHPNVVSIVDLGTIEDIHYVVMEYVEGPSFGTLLKRTGRGVSPALVVAVMIDALEGLHAAHTVTNDEGVQLHLVHRDISPQNILVGADGGGLITDFGVAKAETRIASTRPGVRKGKLAFMAPEQIKDGDNIDLRADIWAAGVVLWTALTGKHLFKGENDAATVLALLTKDVPPPSTEGLKPPAVFDEVVLRALDRDLEKRFGSALEMADALRKAAAEGGQLCSKQDVAKWVSGAFGEELRLRRQAIREVAQSREEAEKFNDVSQTTVPPLPAMSSGPYTSTDPTTGSPNSFGPGGTGSFARTVVESNISSVSSSAQLGDPTRVASPLKSRLWVVIAVLGALLVAAATLLIREPSGGDQKSAAPSSGVAFSAVVPGTAAPEQPKDSPSANAVMSASQANGDAGQSKTGANAISEKKPTRFRPHVGRPSAHRTVPATPNATKEVPAPADQAGKSRPTPASTQNPALEKNPYVRR